MHLRLEAQAGQSAGLASWCTICQVAGKNTTDNYDLLQKFLQTPHQLFCNFYRLVGHDERTYRIYELMMNITHAYGFQVETWPSEQSKGMSRTGFQGVDEAEGEEDLGEVGDN